MKNTLHLLSIIFSITCYAMAPHMATSGVTLGDDDWLYGTVRYNGVNNNGGLYRIKKDGTGFNVLYQMTYSLGPTTRPYFHTDGKILNRVNAKHVNLVHVSVSNLPAGGYIIKVISSNKIETVPFIKQNR